MVLDLQYTFVKDHTCVSNETHPNEMYVRDKMGYGERHAYRYRRGSTIGPPLVPLTVAFWSALKIPQFEYEKCLQCHDP